MRAVKPEPGNKGIGLALSGGGFRATLFHLGTLWRINEMGMLPSLSAISAVSGGSLVAGLLGTRWGRLGFQNDVAAHFAEEVVQPTLRFCGINVDVKSIIFGPFTGSSTLESFYEKHLVGKTTLQDLPDYPEFIFNAYHLETGRNWRFSKARTHTWRIGDIKSPTTPMKKVLAASTAFPPWFPAVRLRMNPEAFQESESADHFQEPRLRTRVTLGDGGVYDNLGFHPLREMKDILVSNGSSPLHVETMSKWKFWVNRAIRPLGAALEQTRALRITALMNDLTGGRKRGALWMISTDPTRYSAGNPFVIAEGWPESLGRIRTRLNRFTEEEQKRLVNWGYIQADLAIRSYYRPEIEPPDRLPFPEYGFDVEPMV